jgi:hypothetical protein
MRRPTLLLALLLLLCGVAAQTPQYYVTPIKKGLTLQATVFPAYENSWAGRFSCNNCNPFEGDTPCNRSLPLLCLSNPRSVVRPSYKISIEFTPFTVLDGGFYDGWTGGVFTVTLPVRGSEITSYAVGDKLCKDYFGPNAKFAEFDDGHYMAFMNQNPQKTYSLWDWAQTKRGGWNMWGYFNHRYRGRAWAWVKNQPYGNCGN